MFSGLIEAMGEVRDWRLLGSAARLEVRTVWPTAAQADRPTQLGDSVAVNGCCLTVVSCQRDGEAEALGFDLSHETIERTAFARLTVGQRVNLERALRLGDRLGGHLVSGHVDGVATLDEIRACDGAWDVWYRVPALLEPELAVKGSVTLDGVSLTVNALQPGRLQVTLIPHTVAHTQLLDGGAGKAVHIETDLIAKHVRRLLERGALASGSGLATGP